MPTSSPRAQWHLPIPFWLWAVLMVVIVGGNLWFAMTGPHGWVNVFSALSGFVSGAGGAYVVRAYRKRRREAEQQEQGGSE